MIYIKGLLVLRATLALTLLALLMTQVNGGHTKIAYKKPIYGSKSHVSKEKVKYPKTPKAEVIDRPPATQMNSTTDSPEQLIEKVTLASTTIANDVKCGEQTMVKVDNQIETAEKPHSLADAGLTATAANMTLTLCTCGIFMASQIKRNSNSQAPVGAPVIANELDRAYPCTAAGQKQCQTKCLESIVQHLPNSANILCATLDRDVRKERAYLFIKNCRNSWINTNLAAGREYCCRNGQPYQCPLV